MHSHSLQFFVLPMLGSNNRVAFSRDYLFNFFYLSNITALSILLCSQKTCAVYVCDWSSILLQTPPLYVNAFIYATCGKPG